VDSLIARKELELGKVGRPSAVPQKKGERRSFYREVGFTAEVIRASRGIILQGTRGGEKTENGRVRRVIRFLYRIASSPPPSLLRTLFVSRLAPLPFFFLARLVLDSPNYSPGYTFSGFHGAAVRPGRDEVKGAGGRGTSFAPRIEPRTIK